MSSSQARVALFTDSFHEVNGVALTCRQFESYAKRHDIPMFSCHAGPANCTWSDGSITRCEWKRSDVAIRLEADLSFDLLFFRQLKETREALRRFKPDVVHVTSPGDCGFLGLLLARELGVPVAASWHTNIHEFGARRLERLLGFLNSSSRHTAGKHVEDRILDLTLLFYKLAKVLFAPNPELVHLLERRLRKSCGLMSRGIDTAQFSPARRQREDSKFRIGYVGRLSVEKNLMEFGAVEQGLVAKGLTGFEMVFVGHGSVTERLRAAVSRSRFTGVLRGDALAREYAGFDAFVFPSRTDTFGNVVLEALASGVPAIVTDAGGPRFLVRDGETGYVVSDTARMVARTATLMEQPDLRLRMAAAAREYTREHHGWDSVFSSVYAYYNANASDRECASLMQPVPNC